MKFICSAEYPTWEAIVSRVSVVQETGKRGWGAFPGLKSASITFKRIFNLKNPSPFHKLTHSYYCAFHKHANCNVQKPPSQLRFSLPSIIITITSNEPGSTETHKTDRNPTITNHKPRSFWTRLSKVLFPKRSVKMIDGSEKRIAIVSWLLNFRIRMFAKSAVKPGKLWVSSLGRHTYRNDLIFRSWRRHSWHLFT